MEPVGVPFLLAVGASNRINKTRLLESVIQSVIVAGVVAGLGFLYAFPVVQEQVAQMRREGLETRQAIVQLAKDMKQEFDSRAARRDTLESAQDARIVQLQIELARRGR